MGTSGIMNDVAQDPALLAAVEDWHVRNWAALAGAGVVTTLRPASTNRDKNSTSISFESPVSLVEAVVWDSGEAEVISANKDERDDPAVRVLDLSAVEDVTAMLDDLRAELLG
jgi:hypothetical protein